VKFPTEILVAVIGLAGLLIPILYQSYSSFFLEKPFLDINIKPMNDTAEIKIKNIGLSSADNIVLFIYSEEIIKSVINTLSTVDISLIDVDKNISKVLNLNEPEPVNDRFVKLEIPELQQGGGSFVTLMTIGNETLIPKNNESNYQVYATFKQGSIRGELEKNLLNKQISAIINFLADIGSNLYFIISYFVVYFLFLLPYGFHRNRIRKFQKHIDNIIDDIIRFIYFYKDEPFDYSTWNNLIKKKTIEVPRDIIRQDSIAELKRNKFEREYEELQREYKDIRTKAELKRKELKREYEELQREYKDIRNMLSVKDFSLIYKFYNKIQNRNSLYEKYKTDSDEDKEKTKNQIKASHHDCVKYANKILKEISWSNYKSSGIFFVTSWIIMIKTIYDSPLLRKKWFKIYLIGLIIFTIIIYFFYYI
jgi:hypothetical protein